MTAARSPLARAIAAHSKLMQRVCEFDQCPADYLEKDRRRDFCPADAPDGLWENARARRHLSRHILRTLDLPSCWDPSLPEWPVALLDAHRIERVALHVAAAASFDKIRRSLSRLDTAAWREWLTPQPYAFAQQSVALLPLKLPASLAIDRSVEAAALGRRWLARAAAAWVQPVGARFMLKLPKADTEHPFDVDARLAARLVACILPIVEPRWCSSFATTGN